MQMRKPRQQLHSARYETMLREWAMGKLGRTFKEPAGRLKFPFVDPGGGYEGNLWDWDSFWAVYGTAQHGR
jgi:putative isomerase